MGFIHSVTLTGILMLFFQTDLSPSSNIPNSQTQQHQRTQRELVSPAQGPGQHISPPGSAHQPKFQSQHETTTDISPTKKPRLSEMYVKL